MKKNILLALICLASLPAWADGNPMQPSGLTRSVSIQSLQPAGQPSFFAPSLRQKMTDFIDWYDDSGVSFSYVFSPVYQMSFKMGVYVEYFYFSSEGGFNFGKKTFETSRSVEDPFNPLSYNLGSLGFKLGPVSVGCGVGYTWNTEKAHWLYCFGALPGLVASTFGKILDKSPNFFNGVYFMWGPEAQLQVGPVLLSCSYHMYPKLNMDHLSFGIGIFIPAGFHF